MVDLTSRQFRMVTNMKAAPGSQGTLFQGGNPTRYPRGYTPERQREIRGAIHPKTRADMRNSPGVRAIVDTVARSTVPAEQVANVRFVEMEQNKRWHGLQVGGGYSVQLDRDRDFEKYGHVTVHPSQVSGATPIHELGHHVSGMMGRQSFRYDTVARKGADEGFAETFAETHFRDRRGRPDPDYNAIANPLKWSNGMGDTSRKTFAKHFNKEREGAPSYVAAQRADERKKRQGEQLGLDLGGPIYARVEKVAPWRRSA